VYVWIQSFAVKKNTMFANFQIETRIARIYKICADFYLENL